VFGAVKEIDILRSLLYMHDAGMSMHEIMHELSGSIKQKKLAAKLEVIDNLMVNEGYDFPSALESAGLFERYIPILRTGQKTGSLSNVIKEILATHDKIESIKGKVKTMTLYPVILMFVSIGLGFGISFVLEKVLTSLPQTDIQGTTAYEIATFIVHYRAAIFPLYAVGLAVVIWFIARNASRIPVVRTLFNAVTVGQCFKMISLCITSGLSLRETFDLTAMILSERKWRQVIEMLAVECQERDLYDLVEEVSDFISTTDLMIIRSNIKAGNMSHGFDFVGEKKIVDSYTMIERTSPLMQIGAYLFVGLQVVLVMSPLYALLIGYAGKV
jgi:type IV pilus assembly protein PilC